VGFFRVQTNFATAARLRVPDEWLIASGPPSDEAMAFVGDASTPRQRVTLATLGTAADVASRPNAEAPTLIVIGPVLTLRTMIAPLQEAAPMTLEAVPRVAARRLPRGC
jgi:siroheme synthase